jgi:hypothetical protein
MKPTDEIKVPAGVNAGLSGCGNSLMLSVFGHPRYPVTSYGTDCRPVTNPKLMKQIVTDNVGPFRVTGHKLAVADLKLIFAAIKAEKPMEYATLGTAGMLCCRLVRGSKVSISNHSWGTAIDLTVNRVLDERGDNKTQTALAAIAPIFNRHGWFWGATFKTEDAMHFEVSAQRIASWKAKGLV